MFEEEQQWEKALRLRVKIVYAIDPIRYPERINPHRVEHMMALCQLEGYVTYILSCGRLYLMHRYFAFISTISLALLVSSICHVSVSHKVNTGQFIRISGKVFTQHAAIRIECTLSHAFAPKLSAFGDQRHIHLRIMRSRAELIGFRANGCTYKLERRHVKVCAWFSEQRA